MQVITTTIITMLETPGTSRWARCPSIRLKVSRPSLHCLSQAPSPAASPQTCSHLILFPFWGRLVQVSCADLLFCGSTEPYEMQHQSTQKGIAHAATVFKWWWSVYLRRMHYSCRPQHCLMQMKLCPAMACGC